ncbi:hypothetical protein DPMN_086520 [Dreissena polymorpha]|uniref:Uncharacterized protein n=1 Tax=Dreissena polymorpha TaxID=45954 RepID=A0A9D4KRM6_DREPO|nr:hypothetical protein DPMN_086520 [Dreissena polymorpha]
MMAYVILSSTRIVERARLDPLNVPKLTASELAEKQRQADEKREQEIRRKKSASLKASRRRLQILEAQTFEQEFQQKEKQEKIEEALESAEKTRDAKLKERQERQKIREQRAERAREKEVLCIKLNELDHELDIEVEKDSDYNADEASYISTSYFLQSIADYYSKAYYRQIWTLSSPFPGKNQYLVSIEEVMRTFAE